MSTFTEISLYELWINISNAFIGTIADMYTSNNMDDKDSSVRLILKENRYMYLALLILIIMILGNLLYTSN